MRLSESRNLGKYFEGIVSLGNESITNFWIMEDNQLDNIPVSEEEEREIEKQLTRIYKQKLVESDYAENLKFERMVKAPLYLALVEYFFDNKTKMACVLGIKRDKLIRIMVAYFKTSQPAKLQAEEKGNRLYHLYLSYLGQFYIDDVNSRFGDVVNRAKLIAVMEYWKDDLFLVAETLGVRTQDLKNELIKYFNTTKLCNDEIKEAG